MGARHLLKDVPWMVPMLVGFSLSLTLLFPAMAIWIARLTTAKDPWYYELAYNAVVLETFRWSILTSLFCFAFFMSATAFTIAPVASKHSIAFFRRTGQALGSLRYILAFFTASFVLLVFYSRSEFSVDVASVDIFDATTSDEKGFIFIKVISSFFNAVGKHILEYRSYFKYIPYILFILSMVLLIEKLCILYLSHSFHKDFYTKRILQNDFILKSFEVLSERFRTGALKKIKPGSMITKEVATIHAENVFKELVSEGNDRLVIGDFLKVLEHPAAVELFKYLDFNKSEDVSLSEFTEAILESYDEKRILIKSLKANESVIHRIDSFFVTSILIFTASLLLPNIDISMLGFLGYIIGSALPLKFAFEHFLNQIVNSAMHFLIAHPYDVGDKVKLGHDIYRVKDMNFWTTTFIGPSGRFSYILNHTLFDTKFGNYRRSDVMEDDIDVLVNPNTTEEQLSLYVNALNDFIKANGRHFDEHAVVKHISICNQDAMSICIGITHKFNFNNDDNYNARKAMIFKNMTNIAKEQNLEFLSVRFATD